MSHVAIMDLEIKDLDALKLACERLGLIWQEGKTSYVWYSRHVGDYPLPKGYTKADLGKCTHAITVPGARYEIGVDIRNDQITLLWDFYSAGGLQQVLGNNGGLLQQAYAIEVAKLKAMREGYNCVESVNAEGEIELEIQMQ